MNFKNYYKYTPFFIFLAILLVLHGMFDVVTGDYPTFKTIVSKHPLFSLAKDGYLNYRYATWSSRSIIEFNVGVLVSIPTEVWRILDSVIFASVAVLISKLFDKNTFLYNSLSCVFVGVFMLTFSGILWSAGCIATTTNYIWPFCFILLHFYLLKEFVFKNKEISKFKEILIDLVLIVTLLEAVSSEQLLVMVAGAYLFIIIYCLYKKIEIPKIMYLFIALIAINFAYDFYCPGNANRVGVVTKLGFPDFAKFSLINKVDVGVNYFLSWILMGKDIFSIIFLGLLGAYTYLISKKKIALIPLIMVVFFKILSFTSYISYFDLTDLKHGLLSLDPARLLVCGGLYLVIVLITLFSIYLIYKNDKKLSYVIFSLLTLGFGSVVISGFTPSLTSNGRIFIYYVFIMIILDYILIKKIFEFKNKNKVKFSIMEDVL
jgi:hypothetical protein